MDFKDLAEYQEYWKAKLNTDNHGTATLMLQAVEGVEDAESLEKAEPKIQEAIKLANDLVLHVVFPSLKEHP